MDGTAEATSGGATILPKLAAFALWWRDGLISLLPPAWLARMGRRPAAIDCFLQPDGRVALALAGGITARSPGMVLVPGEDAFAERLAGLLATANRDTVRLSIPRGDCLMRTVELPRPALAHAGTILRYEIEALLPVPPDDIMTDWYVELEDRAGKRLILRQVALLRPRIAAVEAALQAAGARLVRVTVGDGEGRPVPVDLFNERRAGPGTRFRALPRTAQALFLAAAALLLATLAVLAGRPAETLAAMAEQRASFARPSIREQSAAAVADFLVERQRPGAALLLDEIATRLPKNAFLRSLALTGDALVLTSGGPGAADGAAALAQSPLFSAAETLTAEPGLATLSLRIAAPFAGGRP
ncbi:hypothetical protein ASG43_06130 [Aureimonas sp. Leaf454]|uniref:hypothetical protein n=1 Tax=Aureimonas sp. Leaf454 TaxID=1736381 RepID=UPI0006FF5D87|nr:hypothetical protein [Aureimonas sp. Leaf454]KQT50837.1 hypothetical protein ASG43_06130 [Aureimonas sp. Leaf454]